MLLKSSVLAVMAMADCHYYDYWTKPHNKNNEELALVFMFILTFCAQEFFGIETCIPELEKIELNLYSFLK